MPNRGGYYRDKQGYEMIRAEKDHPYKDTRGYIRINRFFIEGTLTALNKMSVYLHPSVNVEHIDGNKNNYTLSNLKVVGRGYRTPKPFTKESYSNICVKCNGPRKAKFAGGLCEKCYDRKVVEDSGTHPCACGCGELIPKIYKDGKPRLYKRSHSCKGEKNVNWNGGVRIDKDGYRYIKKPEHPYCDYAGYVPEHRLVMENYYSIIFDEGVFIPKDLEVHHIEPVTKTKCNNSISNLELVTHKEHGIIHKDLHVIDMIDRFCSRCKSKNTYMKKDRPVWFKDGNGGFLCNNCYLKNKREKEKNDGNLSP